MISRLLSRRGKCLSIATVALGCWTLLPASAPAAPIGSISGTVTAADTHAGLEGVEACASRFVEIEEEGERVESCATADSTGAYSIDGLDEGEYEVAFLPRKLPYFSPGEDESVTVGGPVTGVDAELEPAAMIEGVVSAAGQPVVADEVCAWRLPEIEKGLCITTGASGRYAIRFATAGDFRVEFRATGDLAAQYFDHADHAPEAQPVTAALGAIHSGVDASLKAGGSVRGTVRSSSGGPVEEIYVCAIDVSGGEPAACDETGVFGQYSVGPLASGSYKIGFSVELGLEFFGEALYSGEWDGFETRFYDEQTSLAAATAVSLSAPGAVSGIDAHLVSTEPSTVIPPPVVTVIRPPAAKPKPESPRCRRGFKKRKVHGKQRCVKVHSKRRKR